MRLVKWCVSGVLSVAMMGALSLGIAAPESSVLQSPAKQMAKKGEESTQVDSQKVETPSEDVAAQKLAKATFAGGCFWCMEAPFDVLEGVISTTSGYAGGMTENPTYQQVSDGGTGHAEVVQVVYDPSKVSYEKLLEVYWKNIDPTAAYRQFCDSGYQYRSAIFFQTPEQEKAARESAKHIEAQLKAEGKADRIYTEIAPLNAFYPAEDYHQDYYQRNPVRYKYYRYRCGRDQRLEMLWGKSQL